MVVRSFVRSFPKTLILHSRCGEPLGSRRETNIATFSPLIIFYQILVVIGILQDKPFALTKKKVSEDNLLSCFLGVTERKKLLGINQVII